MLAAWDAFQKEWPHDSHNPRPSCFGPSQLYLVMLLEDGGWDLECTAFDKDVGWRQATSVFWQVVRALADAEKNLEFEVSFVFFCTTHLSGCFTDIKSTATCMRVRSSSLPTDYLMKPSKTLQTRPSLASTPRLSTLASPVSATPMARSITQCLTIFCTVLARSGMCIARCTQKRRAIGRRIDRRPT